MNDLKPGMYLDCGALKGGGYVSVRKIGTLYQVVYDIPEGTDDTDKIIACSFSSLKEAEEWAWKYWEDVKNIYQPWRQL